MTEFKFLTSGGIQNETTFNANNLRFDTSTLSLKSDMSFKETAFRLNLDAVKSPYGDLNLKQIAILNEQPSGKLGLKENQTRLTYNSPKLPLFKNDKLDLNGQLENRSTIKYDKNFKYTEFTNSLRPKVKLDAKGLPLVGDIQFYSAYKIDYLKEKGKYKLMPNGALVGAEKEFGKSKRITAGFEVHVPAKLSQFKDKTTAVACLGLKLWK